MKIAVGSENPVKIEAVRTAFLAVWPDGEWEVAGVAAASGVSDQPMSDEECIAGAKNRARLARAASNADYGVGLEGGLHRIGDVFFDCGWIVVCDREGREGIGSTAKVPTPPRIVAMIQEGMELGTANDIVFGVTNSKQSDGHFGLMTKGIITRAIGYRDGVIMALARFIHPELF